MKGDQLPEIIPEPWKLLDKVPEVIRVGFADEMMDGPDGCYRKRLVEFVAGAQRINIGRQLPANVLNGGPNAIFSNVYPGQPQMCFVVKNSRIQGAVFELLFKQCIAEFEM